MSRKDKPIAGENEEALSLGARLRLVRQEKGISLTRMAELLGYTKGYVSSAERGINRASRELVERYEKVLELQSGELMVLRQETLSTEPQLEERFWGLPYHRNIFFTGRDEFISRIYRTLMSPKGASHIFAITGLGGIGKTQVAIEYAYRYRAHYQAVFWLKADSLEVLETEFASIANAVLLPRPDGSNWEHGSDVKRWLRSHHPCLLIIDSLDNPGDLEGTAKLLLNLGETHVIITTRLQSLGEFTQFLQLGAMSEKEGALFLLHRIHSASIDNSFDDVSKSVRMQAEQVSNVMGGLPLAIDQAGSYIAESGCSLSHYLHLFASERNRLLKERGKSFSDHPHSVATTWSLTLEMIKLTSPPAMELLYLCAFLDPDAIYKDIFFEGESVLGAVLSPIAKNPIMLDQAIGELRKYSLINSNLDTGVLSIHRLMQTVIRDAMTQRDRHRWAQRTVRAVNCVFPRVAIAETNITTVDLSTWSKTRRMCRKYFAHAHVCAELIKDWKMTFLDAADLLSKLGRYSEEISAFDYAERFYLDALDIDEKIEGVQLDRIIMDRNYLAMFYEGQRKHKLAETQYQETIDRVGLEYPSQTMTALLSNYANLLDKLGRGNEALRLRKHITSRLTQQVKYITVNDDDDEISYQGNWVARRSDFTFQSGDYGGNVHYTSEVGSSFTYDFLGIGIAILSDTASAQGIVDIFIDDNFVWRQDTTDKIDQGAQTTIFQSLKLEQKTHTLKVELIQGSFILDALTIFSTSEN